MMVRFLFLVRLIYKAIFSEEMKGNSDEQLSKFKMLLIKTTLVSCQRLQLTNVFLCRAGISSWMKKVHPWVGRALFPQAYHSAWQREISR